MTKKVNPITQNFLKPFVVLLLLLISVTAFSGCLSSGAADGDTLSIYYTLTLEDGTEFESNVGGQPFSVVLGQHTVVPGFENALYGMKVNETKTVTLQPEEAYPYNPDNVVTFDKAVIVENIGSVPNVGDEIWQSNGLQSFKGIVKEVTETAVVIDFNSEVAGKVLTFEITIADIQKGKAP
jgi:FKBP-type peptidyl-prolyl cis-trans isomerases 2